MGYNENIRKAIENSKNKLSVDTAKKLRTVYMQAAKELTAKFKKLPANDFNRAIMQAYIRNISTYIRKMNDTIADINTTQYKSAARLNKDIFSEVLQQHVDSKIPQEVLDKMYGIPENAIRGLIEGDLYKDKLSLDTRIWRIGKKYSSDIQSVLTQGIIQKKPFNEIVNDLSKYLDPKAKKGYDWSTVYPGTNKQVDFNAQRLARTGINHAFHIGTIASANNDPYAQAIHWELSAQHEIRQVIPYGPDECDDFARQDGYNLGKGNFPINETPVPHPLCLCTQTIVYTKSLEDIGKEINAWIKGAPNEGLDAMMEADMD